MNYPTPEMVDAAEHTQLGYWYRYLPSPRLAEEVVVLTRIITRFREMGGFTPGISKAVDNMENGKGE